MYCEKCGCHFTCSTHTPACVVLCPDCCKIVKDESEYGFGECFPTGYYLGEIKVAEIRRLGTYPDISYLLHWEEDEDIPLEKNNYPELRKTSDRIVYEWLSGHKDGE